MQKNLGDAEILKMGVFKFVQKYVKLTIFKNKK